MDFSIAWVLWLLGFAFIEGIALLNKKTGDTLSEHVYRWFKIKEPRSIGRTLRMGALGLFLGWLMAHWLSGGAV